MPSKSRPAVRRIGAIAIAGLLASLSQLPTGSAAAPNAPGSLAVVDPDAFVGWGDSPLASEDVDTRGAVQPTAAQRSAASALDASVRWNRFGTPSSIFASDGQLGTGGAGGAAADARGWLRANRAVFGLAAARFDAAALEVVSEQKFADSGARAVLFRQVFDGLAPAISSMVTVGVTNNRIVYVSSSLTRTGATTVADPTLTPRQGWLAAADSVDAGAALTDITGFITKNGWSRFKVAGMDQEQQVRLRALATANGTVRPVYEANVVDVSGGDASAYTVMVDAVSGAVRYRESLVEHAGGLDESATGGLAATESSNLIQGEITATECGPAHDIVLSDNLTKQIVVSAGAAVTTNDIVIKLFAPGGALLTSADTGTSPEVLTYAAALIPAGTYTTQVCPFDAPTVPFVPPGTYAGNVTTSNATTPPVELPYPPRWKYFAANPALNFAPDHTPTNSVTGCWVTRFQGSDVPGCTTPPGSLNNLAARAPWDYSFTTREPTLTTSGNAANTREAWLSPLTPGGGQAPTSPERMYTDTFTDAWNNSKCDPTGLVPGGNDINASVTNLFVQHNRMHDYSYFLGFTEENYNMQVDNLGQNPDPSRQNDPEVGNAQAGAISGGSPSYLGRDNANQITLQDGIPGITNQYLFQPIAAAFYSPCVDGGFDMSVVGHEYTHAISNRMIGGPDEGITSEQGGAMGESWGDLVGMEYLFSHGYSTGTSPFVVGPYATGNATAGIRDYAIDTNPLHYGDYGFDSTGPEVHADGEIWNAVQYDVRQALVNKWNAAFPYTNKPLQLACAQGTGTSSPLPSTQCPGNRRWVQLMFDAFLLQQGATSMLDARDAMLAADQMRYGGANQAALWLGFARNGMGSDALTPTADSDEPTPGYQSPFATEATVRFTARAMDQANTPLAPGAFYIGNYQARVTPVADTIGSTSLDNVVQLTPGTYPVLFRGTGQGLKRFSITVTAGQTLNRQLQVATNLASQSSGATIASSSPGSLNPESLIDDSEGTNWAGINETESVDTSGSNPYVVVDLAGGSHVIREVRVSAMLRPADAAPSDVPLAADPDAGSRFTALRKFAIETCVQSATNACTTPSAVWTRIYTSANDAFPAIAPRPVAPNLNLRTFNIPDRAATHVRLVALENQCTGFSGYAGEQDNDPLNDTDCKAASDRDQSVRAAELQVFGTIVAP